MTVTRPVYVYRFRKLVRFVRLPRLYFRTMLFENIPSSSRENNVNGENLNLTFSPVFSLSRILTIFPLGFGRCAKFRYLSSIYGIVVLAVIFIYEYSYVRQILLHELSGTNVVLYSGYACLNVTLCAACVIAPLINAKTLNAIVEGFRKTDTAIKQIHSSYKFGERRTRQNVHFVFTVLVTIIFGVLHRKATTENLFPAFTYLEFYILPVTWLLVFQIDYFLIHMDERFAFVNTQLEKMLRDCSVAGVATISSTTSPSPLEFIDIAAVRIDVCHLNKLNLIHFKLYEISQQVNKIYSDQLLIMIPRLIFFCVLPIHYNIVTALVKSDRDTSVTQTWTHVFTICYVILLTSPVIYVVRVASGTIFQAKKIYLLIHDLIDENQEEHIEYELLQISIQLLHRKIEFSVRQFFCLRSSLITAIFELVITYVIILLQFQDTLASISPIRSLLRPLIQQ